MDVGALNREAVLSNAVVFGSVNANRDHYTGAARALAGADPRWLARPDHPAGVARAASREAFARRDDDVKVVLTLAD